MGHEYLTHTSRFSVVLACHSQFRPLADLIQQRDEHGKVDFVKDVLEVICRRLYNAQRSCALPIVFHDHAQVAYAALGDVGRTRQGHVLHARAPSTSRSRLFQQTFVDIKGAEHVSCPAMLQHMYYVAACEPFGLAQPLLELYKILYQKEVTKQVGEESSSYGEDDWVVHGPASRARDAVSPFAC